MKVEVELKTTMSRPETMKAAQIVIDASIRLAHRMNDHELRRLENYGAALIAVAQNETQARQQQRPELGPCRASLTMEMRTCQ